MAYPLIYKLDSFRKVASIARSIVFNLQILAVPEALVEGDGKSPFSETTTWSFLCGVLRTLG